jgi:hypothetical protein
LFPKNGIALEAYEKIQGTCMPRGQSNIGVDSLPMPTLSKSVGIIALFEKIYDGEPWMM